MAVTSRKKNLVLASVLLLFTLSNPMVCSGEDSGASELDTVHVPDRTVRFFYPKGWQVEEYRDEHPYSITAHPAVADSVGSIVELMKYYHAATSLNPSPPFHPKSSEELVDNYLEKLSREFGGTTLKQEALQVQGVPAKLVELKAENSNGITGRMLVFAAAKDDVLVALHCLAREEVFEAYRPVFRSVIDRTEPFSADPANLDNVVMDRETERLQKEAAAALRAEDAKGTMERLGRAVRMNPSNIAVLMDYGGVLFEAWKHTSGDDEDHKTTLENAEGLFLTALNLFNANDDPGKEVALSQVYYMLGQIAEIGRKDEDHNEQAKMFYKAAVHYNPENSQAQEALKRYGG